MSIVADIESILRQFDELFPTIQPGEVAKMNQAIGILNGINPKIQELGAKDSKKANEFVTAFNNRMGQVKELSQKPAPPKPKTTNLTQTLGPVQSSGWQNEPDEYEETTLSLPPPRTPATLPPDIHPIIAEFERIQKMVQGIDQLAVWTGRSNDVVHAWDAFLQNHARRLVEVIREFAPRDEKLRDLSQRYNELPQNLSAVISRFDIDERSKTTIRRFNADFDKVVKDFKSAPTKNDAQRHYSTMQQLNSSLQALHIPTHPSVSAGLEASALELQNMRNWLSQSN